MIQPGRMPIAYEGIMLNICLFGAIIGSLIIPPVADFIGRKLMLEISLLIVMIFSFFQAFTFYSPQARATGNHVVGTICFWRIFMGFGIGGIAPLAAIIMSEYSSRYSRGAYVSLTFSMTGLGLLLLAGVCGLASYGVGYNWVGNEFPVVVR
jgi:MFS transporter, PHS family, inorganic phosphate transporter